jgi:hypothetical protein
MNEMTDHAGSYRCLECGTPVASVGELFRHRTDEHSPEAAQMDALHVEALREAFQRAKSVYRHDEGLIQHALLYGWQTFSIASRLGISADYVQVVVRQMRKTR